MVKVETVIFNEVPKGAPIPGQTIKLQTSELDLDNVPLNGGVLVKTVALSLDPYLRGKMRSPDIPSYSPPFYVGKPLDSDSLSRVLRSGSSKFNEGDLIYGRSEHATYKVIPKETVETFRVVDNKAGIPLRTFVGAAGMSGLTAFHGFNLAEPKKGETIFVTAAAGAVGQIVVQLAKADGLKVVASAGDAQKVAFLKEIGADVAFNYKEESTAKVLAEHPFDIFFDNVGGETLDDALAAINRFGRIIACGAVSQYNLAPEERYGLKNYMQVVGKQITWRGFIVPQVGPAADKFYVEFPNKIKKGEIKVREHVVKGLDDGQALVDMLSGKSQGKVVIDLE